MPAKMGRPLSGSHPKNIKLQIRVDKPTLDKIDACAASLKTTRTGALLHGIELVEDEIKTKK